MNISLWKQSYLPWPFEWHQKRWTHREWSGGPSGGLFWSFPPQGYMTCLSLPGSSYKARENCVNQSITHNRWIQASTLVCWTSPESAIDQSHGRKVLNARKPNFFNLFVVMCKLQVLMSIIFSMLMSAPVWEIYLCFWMDLSHKLRQALALPLLQAIPIQRKIRINCALHLKPNQKGREASKVLRQPFRGQWRWRPCMAWGRLAIHGRPCGIGRNYK